ncbi:hypothetical protein M885DRAFT_584795, partial [Pelagophyceae sp. CCMP2097]
MSPPLARPGAVAFDSGTCGLVDAAVGAEALVCVDAAVGELAVLRGTSGPAGPWQWARLAVDPADDDEELRCVSVHAGRVYVGDSRGVIRSWPLDNDEALSAAHVFAELEGPVRALSIHSTGVVAAAFGDQGAVRVAGISSGSGATFAGLGSAASCLRWTPDSSAPLLAVVDADSRLAIWALDADDADLSEKVAETTLRNGEPAEKTLSQAFLDDAESSGGLSESSAVSWQPGCGADWLAVCGRSEPTLLKRPRGGDKISRSDWDQGAMLLSYDGDESFNGCVTASAWLGPKLLATASSAKVLALWDVSTQSPLAVWSLPELLSSLHAWGSSLVALSQSGRIGAAPDEDGLVLKFFAEHEKQDGKAASSSKDGKAASSKDTEDRRLKKKARAAESSDDEGEGADEEDEEDEEDEGDASQKKKNALVDDEAEEDDESHGRLDEEEEARLAGEAERAILARERGDADDDDEESVVPRRRRAAVHDDADDDDDGDEDDASRLAADEGISPVFSRVMPDRWSRAAQDDVMQPAFQPASTPLGEDDGSSAFLCWSSAGSVVARRDAGELVVEVEHLAPGEARARTTRFTEHRELALAALGPAGAAFAATGEDRDVIWFTPLGGWSRGGEWNATLTRGERCVAVAAGDAFVVCGTTRRLLRFYSLGGVEDGAVSVPGAVVAVVARAGRVAVALHCGAPVGGAQRIAVQLLDVSTRTALTHGDGVVFPLAPSATLKWLGFADDDAQLLAMDSEGAFWALVDDFGWRWTPVLDASESRSNAHDREWPVFARAGAVYCALIKSQSHQYPQAFPTKPVLSPMPLAFASATAAHDDDARLGELAIAAPTILARQRRSTAAQLRVALEPRPSLLRLAAQTEAQVEALAGDAAQLERAATGAVAQRDKALLRLLLAALKADKLQRALDLAARLGCADSLNLALRLADAHGVDALSTRIESIIAARDAAAQRDEPQYAPRVQQQHAPREEQYEPRHEDHRQRHDGERPREPEPADARRDDTRADDYDDEAPAHSYDDEAPPTPARAPARAFDEDDANPFKVRSAPQRPGEKRSALQALGDLTFSPSPKKRAAP